VCSGFFAIFSLMILVSWLSLTTLQGVNTSMSELSAAIHTKTSHTHQIRDTIRLRSTAISRLLNTQWQNADVPNVEPMQSASEREKFQLIEQIDNYTTQYNQLRLKLKELAFSPQEKVILAKISNVDNRISEAYTTAVSAQVNLRKASAEHSTNGTDSGLFRSTNTRQSVGHSLGRTGISFDGLYARSAYSDLQEHEVSLLRHLDELIILDSNLAQNALKDNQRKYEQTKQWLLCIVGAAFALALLISSIVAGRINRANSRIAHLANHDDLTGLHNRRSFEQHLKQTIAIAERSENIYGLLFIDMDHFKIVNDTSGHHAGDQLLIQLTRMLSDRLRRGDLFARVGGDEFAIIAQGKSFNDIRVLAEDIRLLVNDFTFYYEEHAFKVSLSIGVTPIDGQERSLEKILTDVDSACYVAKNSGRNSVHVTEDNDVDVVRHRNKLANVQNIRRAITDSQLSLFYQPIFDIEDVTTPVSHYEMTLRVHTKNGDLFQPHQFLPIAEKYQLKVKLDRWTLQHTINWLEDNQADLDVSYILVHLSAQSIIDAEFIDFVFDTLERSEIDTSTLVFEISESTAVHNLQNVKQFMRRMEKFGCELALSDIGSGLAGLNYLKQLSLKHFKINGALAKNIANDMVDRQLVSAINSVAHTVGAKTIAQMVEDEKTIDNLRALKVNFVQGDQLKEPMPLEHLTTESDNGMLAQHLVQAPVQHTVNIRQQAGNDARIDDGSDHNNADDQQQAL